jgi:ribosomal protein S18 acetylase RimI-like enzyme
VPRIGSLPDQLGYPTNRKALRDQLLFLLNHPDRLLVVGGFEEVEAVMSIHFVPQITLDGDFAIISYLCVDETVRSNGIGEKMEAYCTNIAIDRNCDRIQVHCNIKE